MAQATTARRDEKEIRRLLVAVWSQVDDSISHGDQETMRMVRR